MLGLTLVTGLAGFLTSFALLRLHLTILWLRYGLSVAAAYAVFLVLIWCWVRLHPRTAVPVPGNVGTAHPANVSGWDASDSIEGFFDFDSDSLIPILLALAAFIFLAAAFYTVTLVVAAPERLAEVTLDGAAGAVLYRRIRAADRSRWFDPVFRRTRAPFLAYLAFFVCLGIACRLYAPEAISIGGVLRHASMNKSAN